MPKIPVWIGCSPRCSHGHPCNHSPRCSHSPPNTRTHSHALLYAQPTITAVYNVGEPKFATRQEHVKRMHNPPMWPCSTAPEYPYVVCIPCNSRPITRLWCTMLTYTHWIHTIEVANTAVALCGCSQFLLGEKKKRGSSRNLLTHPTAAAIHGRAPLLPQRAETAAQVFASGRATTTSIVGHVTAAVLPCQRGRAVALATLTPAGGLPPGK
jgi:hypothetical protein